MPHKPAKFGTFAGVFTPTVITILGVIMYLREGWVVGHAGLGGTWLIIAISITIAACTGLSLSSIATNTQIKAGGAYAIISRSLGLEIGTTVGIALYIAQALAIAMYIFGFREGWLSIFPTHTPIFIDLGLFVAICAIAFRSAKLSFQFQYLVMGITAISIIVAIAGPWRLSPKPIIWWGETAFGSQDGFWKVFAVFFPAVTGVMAGASMSGELKNPTRAIPRGTLSAIAVSAVIYFALAYILARMGTPGQLIAHTDILVHMSAAPWFMKIAILCATASSALATLVGAPRILQAVAVDESIPKSNWLKKISFNGEPRNATVITAFITLCALSLRDLNAIAPIITICFLSTYAMINGVVLAEQGLGLVNFRPRMRFPLFIPLIGLVGSVVAMVVIKPALSLSLLGIMVIGYDWLGRQKRTDQRSDVRGNLFVALSQWAAIRAEALPRSESRAWRPHPMIPILDNPINSEGLNLAKSFLASGDSVKVIVLTHNDQEDKNNAQFIALKKEIENDGNYYAQTQIHYHNRSAALGTVIQALRGSFFRPNILCMGLKDGFQTDEIAHVVNMAQRAKMGVVLQSPLRKIQDNVRVLNIWIRPQSPHWDITKTEGNMDLSILIALRVSHRQKLKMRLISTISSEDESQKAREFLKQLVEVGRLDYRSEIQLIVGSFDSARKLAPAAQIQIFGLPEPYNHNSIEQILGSTTGTVLFVKGSGQESVLD